MKLGLVTADYCETRTTVRTTMTTVSMTKAQVRPISHFVCRCAVLSSSIIVSRRRSVASEPDHWPSGMFTGQSVDHQLYHSAPNLVLVPFACAIYRHPYVPQGCCDFRNEEHTIEDTIDRTDQNEVVTPTFGLIVQ